MQLQQLRNQNGLLQQLVQTLERQIQSKNQQQTIMIQQLQHLIKDNDQLSHKYNLLLTESRKWNEKEKYFERLVKDIEETLMKTKIQLNESKTKLQTHTQPVLSHTHELDQGNINRYINHNIPQVQAASQMGNFGNSGLMMSRGNQQLQGSSHLIISVPKLSIQNNQHQTSNHSNKPYTPRVVQQTPISSETTQIPDPSPQYQQQPNTISKLQGEIKSFKYLSQTLKLQLTQKDIQLKSKTQKIHEITQQLSQSQDQVDNLNAVLEQLRKQYDQAVADLYKKQQELILKDQQFFNMYKEIEDEWKAKNYQLQQNVLKFKENSQHHSNQLLIKQAQIHSLTQLISQQQTQFLTQNNLIQQLTVQVQKNQTPNLRQFTIEKQPQQQNYAEQYPSQTALLKNQHQQIQSLKNLVQVLHQTLSDTQNRHNVEMERSNKSFQSKEQEYKQKQNILSSQNNQLKEKIHSVEIQINELREKMNTFECQNNKLMQKINSFDIQKDYQVEGKNNVLETQNIQLKEKINALETQNNQIRIRQNEVEQELLKVRQIDEQLTINYDKLNQEKEQRNNSLRQLAATVEITKVQLSQKDRKLQQNLRQIQIKQNLISELITKVQQLQQTLHKTQSRLQQTQHELRESQNVFTQTQNIIQQLQQENQSLSSPQRLAASKQTDHVELQMFEALQQQYTRLYEDMEDVKQQAEQERSKFIAVVKEKDHDLVNMGRKLQELTNLFAQKAVENDRLRQSIDKQPSSSGILFGAGSKNMPNSQNQIITLVDKNNTENPYTDKPNNKFISPSPSQLLQQQQPRRSLSRQQPRPSLPRNIQNSTPRQQTRQSLPHEPNRKGSNKLYTENLVENNLSSPRSHKQKTPNEIMEDEISESNDGFNVRVQPTVRKSDLPLHSPEFFENNCESKPQRPKSNITSVDENKRQFLQPPVQIDINYLRNSIAQFGLDIDFNAIAKHIGLELSEQEEELKRKEQETKRNKLQSGREHVSVLMNDQHGSVNKDERSNDLNHVEIEPQLNKSKDECSENQENDHGITSKQGLQEIPSTSKRPQGIYSSYGSDPSRSEKRSTPGALRVPMVDEQLMRSSYGSNNQFTQIVLYYEDELNKLRKHINEINQQMDREKAEYDRRVTEMETIIRENDERLAIALKENDVNLVKIQQTQTMLDEMRNQIHAKHILQDSSEMHEMQQQNQNLNNNPPINNMIGNISPVYPIATPPICFPPQTSQFRTSIEPRMTASFQLPQSSSNLGGNMNENTHQTPAISMTPEEQQETVELIRELSSQLEIIQQTLADKQDQMGMLEVRNAQLEKDNGILLQELETIRQQNLSIVNQFSELSLQQNNSITQLQQKIQQLEQQLNQKQQAQEYLTKQNIKLQSQNQQLKQSMTNQNTHYQQQITQLEANLNEKTLMFQKITIQNVEYETQLLQLNQQVQQLVGKLEEIQQIHQETTNKKDQTNKKTQKTLKDLEKSYKELQKTHKQTNEQLVRYTNENETLASQFSKFIQTNKQLELLSEKYLDLEKHTISIQSINQNLQNKYEALQNNYHSLQTYSKSIQTQIISLQTQNKTLLTHNKTLQTQNKALQTQSKALQTQNKSLQSHAKSLETINKNLQEKITKITHIQLRQSGQSPTLPQISRISDLIDPSHQNCHQQNFTINNISNIHAIVDQLGDDSFVLHEKDKEISTLKDVVERQRREIQKMGDEAKERQEYISEMEDKFANIENSFNSELMGIKKQNAQMNSELLRLKKQLFAYQKDSGDIDKFIQENFLITKPILPKRFSVEAQNQERFQSIAGNQINLSQRHNNSFNFEPHNANDISSLSSRNKGNMTQFYYPKSKQHSLKPLNMGEMFIGHKTRPRAQNTPSDNSLTQLIKNITASNKHKSLTHVVHSSTQRPQTNYSKYLNEYQKYEEKIRSQTKNHEHQYSMVGYGLVGHMKKRSDHGE